MSLVSPVFEQHYKDYLEQLAELDFESLGPAVGGGTKQTSDGRIIEISYFNDPHTISPNGIRNSSGQKPGYDTCIILCRYLIMAQDWVGGTQPVENRAGEWTGFRDLKDSGPLTVYFKGNVEQAISQCIAGKISLLPRALERVNGSVPGLDLQYDLVLEVNALPKVPLLLLFNDGEEGFPPSCSVLFQPNVETFLDAECIAMAGYRLAAILREIFS
jgi:hypothetical protein